MKYPLAQQWKAGSPIALSFDQFQFGHMALDHAVIDRPGQASSHSVFVFHDPRSE
jgi:hypothetical protein